MAMVAEDRKPLTSLIRREGRDLSVIHELVDWDGQITSVGDPGVFVRCPECWQRAYLLPRHTGREELFVCSDARCGWWETVAEWTRKSWAWLEESEAAA